MSEKSIIESFSKFMSFVGIFIAMVSFFYYLPFISKYYYVLENIPLSSYIYIGSRPGSTDILIIAAITLIFVILGLSSVFYKNNKIMSFKPKNSFYTFFSLYTAIIIFASVILDTIDPEIVLQSVFHFRPAVENIIYSANSVFQMLLLVLVPGFILIFITLLAKRELTLSNILNPENSIKSLRWVYSVIIAGISVLLTNYGFYNTLMLYIDILFISYIFFSFGFLRALLINFTLSEMDFVAVLFQHNVFIYPVLSIYLFLWAFAGLYAITAYYIERSKNKKEKSEKNDDNINDMNNNYNEVNNYQRSFNAKMPDPDTLWIRSSCPECNGVDFKINDDMSLECLRCHYKIDKDAHGIYNIRYSDNLKRLNRY
ncbi:hypothetical protein [Picrophilus oshimae]|uniref:Uncharacterized protein n=1 Tax=Picrophilus torridus (strain ATCC 700027 / DSM 9790 / JCM 10055 / NBRC 100828 / KAW 2/3) TaxID=1122961 RepID=A0A8G2L7H6_PICTO|nr:hypothetical protein [Picrophilus oshimae]SMD30329.1 hypothetical protein SAMN02745355_0204 [Picrophilus oshimae DSM 9789]